MGTHKRTAMRKGRGMDEFEQQPFSDVEFVENPEQRCPVILLLDTSYSMNGAPIAELNEGLSTLREDFRMTRWRQTCRVGTGYIRTS